MARKYLNEIGLPDEAIEGLRETDPRQQRRKLQEAGRRMSKQLMTWILRAT